MPRNQDTTLGNLIGSAAGEHAVTRTYFFQIIQAYCYLLGEFLQTRSWQGLEQRIDLDEPSVLEQGRDGIAKGYRSVDH